MTAPSGVHAFALLHDAALVVRVGDPLLPLVRAWLPLHTESAIAPASEHRVDAAVIDVSRGSEPSAWDSETDLAPLVLFAGVRAHARAGDAITLRADSGAVGRIELGERRARLALPPATHDPESDARLGWDLYSMLTLAAAFLVGRLGGALVHAGAVIDPEGRAWLLAGDTHAGKTTTCVSLVDAGWSFLADDQVVLRREGDGLVAEGWPRYAHLDEGWSDSVVTGVRGAVDMRARWGDRWQRRAPLGGLLFPAVTADAPTAVAPVHAATAFAGLLRQSPWLIADRGAAPIIIELMKEASARPAFALSLGRDSYARGDVLAARLAPALAAAR